MKKIIISLDHVMGAIKAAYEREIEIKCVDCFTEKGGRLCLRFSLEKIMKSNLDKLEATKWLKMCGCEMALQGMPRHMILTLTVPYEIHLLSGVIFLKMTEKEFNNFFCAVGKTMMKALPVVTLEGIRYDEHSIVGRVGVRYLSGMVPEGVSVTSEIIQLAMLFNGSAEEFKVDQFGGEARMELTLDWESRELKD